MCLFWTPEPERASANFFHEFTQMENVAEVYISRGLVLYEFIQIVICIAISDYGRWIGQDGKKGDEGKRDEFHSRQLLPFSSFLLLLLGTFHPFSTFFPSQPSSPLPSVLRLAGYYHLSHPVPASRPFPVFITELVQIVLKFPNRTDNRTGFRSSFGLID